MYEEKYKKALGKAKRLYEEGTITESLCHIFPELRESEDDVRRRSTIQVLEYARSLDTYNQYGKADIDKNIAWLEKQRESQNEVRYWTEEEIEPIISDFLRGAEHYGGMIARLRHLKPKSLEKQEEPIDKEKVLIGARKDVALSIMNYFNINL